MLTYYAKGEKAMNYNIKQVADKTGLSEATLRYYDKEGLFPDLERKNSGYRAFSERELEQIRYIECFKTAGFEIREIKEYFDLIKRGDETLKERYDIMIKHREILEKKKESKKPEPKNQNIKRSVEKMAEDLGMGVMTLTDIIDEIKKPARDPRESMPGVIFRSDVLSFDDLKAGMELEGTVRNVVDFGAFVDIGVKTDGLVHVSELSSRFIKHPMDVVSIGDNVKVRILDIDKERHKISLTMKL